MTLSKHLSVEALEHKYLAKSKTITLNHHEEYISGYDAIKMIPKTEIPEPSAPGMMVYKTLNEELALDGIPTLNLASFVNTHVNEVQHKLISENVVKNLADNDEYPSLIEFQNRCVTILSNLWHAPSTTSDTGDKITNSIGTATTGSSEAIMLAGLALKKRWQEKRKAQGKDAYHPNIIMASCAQVALEKFATYFDVENRLISITEESNHLINVNDIKKNIDENTIGIFVILGSTFTGAFEPVEKISHLLDEVEKETGLDIRIHVDGASGGFVAPFVFPHLKWDFEVPRVDSINTSGHKFGMTSAGLGWVIWKDANLLPKSLKFSLDYLGGVEETFGLNFSRPGFPVILQYYNFLALGREGYTKIHEASLSNARLLSNVLKDSGYFELLSVIHKPITAEQKKLFYTREHTSSNAHKEQAIANESYEPGLPVVAFRLSKKFREDYSEIPQELISSLLRNKGYIVPNYRLPPDEGDVEVLRVVVRGSFSVNLLDKLVEAITHTVEVLIDACKHVRSIKNSTENKDKSIKELLIKIASAGQSSINDKKEELVKPEKKHYSRC
jgi:glutamate decarboxylase